MAALGCPRSFEDSRPPLWVAQKQGVGVTPQHRMGPHGQRHPRVDSLGASWSHGSADLEHVGSLRSGIPWPLHPTQPVPGVLPCLQRGEGRCGSQLRLRARRNGKPAPAGGVASSQVAPGLWAGGQAADSRQFAWAAPADVYSQPGEERGIIYIPQGDWPQLSPLCLGGQEGRAGAEGAQVVCVAGGTAVQGVGRQEPWFPAGQLVGGLPPLPPASPSFTTCPHILGSSGTAISPRCQGAHPPAGISAAAGCLCLLPTRSAPTSHVFHPGY